MSPQAQYDYEGRVARARTMMREQGIDGLYVVAGHNMRYFLGWTAFEYGWPAWLATLMIPLTGEPILVFSTLQEKIFEHVDTWVEEVRTYPDGGDPRPILEEAFQDLGLTQARLGVDDTMWFGDSALINEVAPQAHLVSSSAITDRLRMIKDAKEIDNLRRSSAISGVAFEKCCEVIRSGVTMREASLEVARAKLDAGSEQLGGFHYYPLSMRVFEPGDIVDVDTSGLVNGYNADNARNVFIKPVSDQSMRMWEVTREAFHRTMEVIRPGVELQEIHRTAARYMAQHGYTQVWKIGHGVGIAGVHDAPLVHEGNTMLAEPGMVFTVDPGCFVPHQVRDTPIHIENTVVVTEDGVENLCSFHHDMLIVP